MTHAITVAVRKQADRLAHQLRGTELEERASELAERIRASETLANVQAKGGQLVTNAQAKAEKLAADAQAKGSQLAEQVQAKGTELAEQAQRTGGQLADCGLRRLGKQLSQGRLASHLGIQPEKRRLPLWLVMLLGIVGGYVLGMLTAPKPGAELRGQLAGQARSMATPLTEKIRVKLSNDPRTATLSDLSVEATDGTVSVQGVIPADFDQDTLREVIAQVPGVHDIDLQVTASA
jgi:hypothetical protein